MPAKKGFIILKKLTTLDINDKIIGSVFPQGETHEDDRVLKRLDEVELLITEYILNLKINSKMVDDYRSSVQKIAERSVNILNNIKETINTH